MAENEPLLGSNNGGEVKQLKGKLLHLLPVLFLSMSFEASASCRSAVDADSFVCFEMNFKF
ncbi:hypothetical protein KY284_005601 [Solanum tuberosum]|nr:hypothetical protein KY284_005601 [Solanum tuberosum]